MMYLDVLGFCVCDSPVIRCQAREGAANAFRRKMSLEAISKLMMAWNSILSALECRLGEALTELNNMLLSAFII